MSQDQLCTCHYHIVTREDQVYVNRIYRAGCPIHVRGQ